VKKVQEAWAACGARVTRMSPEEHDAVLGAVSHLPHVLAYALVHEFAARESGAQLFEYAAGGFRDFTRIASSHPEMWRDICIANSDRILEELRRYRKKLDALAKLLEAGDAAALERLFAEARAAREKWIHSS
jgi:prephenate dehydrogenase